MARPCTRHNQPSLTMWSIASFHKPGHRFWPLTNYIRRDYFQLSQRKKDSSLQLTTTSPSSQSSKLALKVKTNMWGASSGRTLCRISESLWAIILANITKLKGLLNSEFVAKLKINHSFLTPWSMQNNRQIDGIKYSGNSTTTTCLLLQPRCKQVSLTTIRPCPPKNLVQTFRETTYHDLGTRSIWQGTTCKTFSLQANEISSLH